MESSDDSFAWTVGSESESSQGSSNNMVEKHADNSAEESEYGKKYKKKLQQQLFNIEKQNGTIDSETPKKKAKKSKIETEVEDKMVKRGSDSDDEEYLATRVKQEKKHSLNTSSGSHNLSHHSDEGSNKKKRKLDVSIKSEKSKKKRHVREDEQTDTDHLSDYTNIEDKFTAEETIIQPRITNSTSEYKHNKSSSVSLSQGVEAAEQSSDNNSSSKKKNKKKSRVSVSAESDSGQPEPVCNGISVGDTPNKISSKRSSKISEQITFEEDHEPIESDNPSEPSSRLSKYLKRNPNLQPLDCVIERDATITKHDEVWLLKFPHDVDISTLKHSSLTLDAKCKTKIDGKTYDGVIEDGESWATVMCPSTNNKPLIRKIRLNSTVKFNRRLPKIHIVKDNFMVNNQTNFIPLPDTKCRHPLFGSNYKKAIKLPSAIKARLKGVHPEEDQRFSEVKKKKKSKKHKEEVVLPEEEIPRVAKKRKHHEVRLEPEPDQPKPKKKKHKPSTEPVAWESEKAIEENLFNF